jgi:type 1 glutamine amidotransferase
MQIGAIMTNKKVLILQGGWDGHQPELVSKRFAGLMERNGYQVEISNTLDSLADLDKLMDLDLIVACWTMDKINNDYVVNVSKAVGSGVGLAGCHGGMCDSFRENTEWQFITGGQWVSHPGGDGIEYTVNINKGSSPIVEGLDDFTVCSEHYYMHVDPAIEVLATTRFPSVNYYHISNKPVDMPVAWTKFWGNGRVFYNSLGHHDDVFDKSPNAQILMERGMLWAAEGKQYAIMNKLSTKPFENTAKMY